MRPVKKKPSPSSSLPSPDGVGELLRGYLTEAPTPDDEAGSPVDTWDGLDNLVETGELETWHPFTEGSDTSTTWATLEALEVGDDAASDADSDEASGPSVEENDVDLEPSGASPRTDVDVTVEPTAFDDEDYPANAVTLLTFLEDDEASERDEQPTPMGVPVPDEVLARARGEREPEPEPGGVQAGLVKVLITEAEAARAVGDVERARAILEQALELSPQDLRVRLAMTRLRGMTLR